MTEFDCLYQEHEQLRLLLKIVIQNSNNPELRDRYISELRRLLKQCNSLNAFPHVDNGANCQLQEPATITVSAQSNTLVTLLLTLQNHRLPQSEWLANLVSFQQQLIEYLEEREMAFLQLQLPTMHASHSKSSADIKKAELSE